jgi:hypothetical protein
VVAGVVALLALMPAAVAALPAGGRRLPAAELLARVRASAAVPYQGYAQSHATLGLPDVPQAGQAVALLGETTRMRAWVESPAVWRVDELLPGGERRGVVGIGRWKRALEPGGELAEAANDAGRLTQPDDVVQGHRLDHVAAEVGGGMGRLRGERARRGGLAARCHQPDPAALPVGDEEPFGGGGVGLGQGGLGALDVAEQRPCLGE